jgi:hypothetical protein
MFYHGETRAEFHQKWDLNGRWQGPAVCHVALSSGLLARNVEHVSYVGCQKSVADKRLDRYAVTYGGGLSGQSLGLALALALVG